MLYVGLDSHVRQSTYCILEANGRQREVRHVRGPWPKVVEALGRIGEPFAICFEASLGYGHLFDRLRRLAARVVVAHPGSLRLIFRSSRKNDRVDAIKLAKLLYLDEAPCVWVPAADIRAWRAAIEARRRLVSRRTAVKNHLRALLRGLGLTAPGGLWTKAGRAWLQELKLADPCDALRRELALAELIRLDEQVARLTAHLDRVGRRHPGVVLLRTIPGVGPRTAEAVVAYIDRPERFGRVRAIGRYFGMVPRQDASGGVNRLGHITREGPAAVRQFVTEAAWQGIRRSERLRAFFRRVQQDDPKRRKIALTATGHFLLRAMLAMLRTGQTWRESAA